MTPLDSVRGLLDQPGRDLNDAVRHYAEHSNEARYAIKAEPVLYGELARNALRWTADLLTAVERSAATRPASEAVVGVLADRIAAYFEDSDRWPSEADMQHPLRLLMPAYYAVCGVELLEHHVKPRLMRLDHNDFNVFIEEVLGRGRALTIRQHKNADLRSMPKVIEEEAGHEPLAIRSFLTARQRARLAKARARAQPVPADPAPAPAEPAPAQPSPEPVEPDPSAVQDIVDSIAAGLWTRKLNDTRITLRADNAFEPGYSGGSSFYSAQTFLDLLDGGTYRLLESVTSTTSVPGLTIGGDPRTTESSGEWTVRVSGTSEHLRLEDEGGGVTLYAIAAPGSGSVEVDGEDREWTRL